MKTLLLIRHAKSSWDNTLLSDFDRPLNERGIQDAPLMAKRILEKKIKIDSFVSSPAIRARTTASLFMQELESTETRLIIIHSLYEASVKSFLKVVENFNDKDNTVAIFSHNPGITEFVNSLDCFPIYDMPTCSIFALEIKIKRWEHFNKGRKKFLFFDYPKNGQ